MSAFFEGSESAFRADFRHGFASQSRRNMAKITNVTQDVHVTLNDVELPGLYTVMRAWGPPPGWSAYTIGALEAERDRRLHV